jgi:hypothetical protein
MLSINGTPNKIQELSSNIGGVMTSQAIKAMADQVKEPKPIKEDTEK